MKIIKILLLILLFNPIINAEPMQCNIGPSIQEFGGNNWLVYACSDNKSIIAVSAPGNPAMPFFFSISPINGKYKVTGEGNGDKMASDAAYKDLVNLTKEQILNLIENAESA